MARSDLIVELVRAGVAGDDQALRQTAETIAAEERSKKHTVVADRISKVLQTPQRNGSGRSSASGLRVRDGSGGIQRREPDRALSELYLSKIVRESCEELIEEQHRADVLRAHGLDPRHRLLLVGPPGNGKTSLAESIAYELALPLMAVRYEAVITSYLGETAQRLRRLFDYIRTEPCVLFFDEFDAIGKERGDIHETGEIKRVVTSLLLQLDDLPSYCVLICATNHPELLDRATWRRFELKLELARPNDDQMIAYISDRLKEFEGNTGYTAKRLRQTVKATSYSDAENFFLDVRRRLVLNQGIASLRSIIDDRVKAWNERAEKQSLMGGDDRKADTSTA